jgi:hypothetical protein
MSRMRWPLILAAVAGLAWLGWRYEHGMAHGIGVDTQQSQEYDFVSGVGPMIIAAIGYISLIAAGWHALNCHQPGCWRVGRHKVGGTPWCNRHHGKARPELTVENLLETLIERIDVLTEALTGGK